MPSWKRISGEYISSWNWTARIICFDITECFVLFCFALHCSVLYCLASNQSSSGWYLKFMYSIKTSTRSSGNHKLYDNSIETVRPIQMIASGKYFKGYFLCFIHVTLFGNSPSAISWPCNRAKLFAKYNRKTYKTNRPRAMRVPIKYLVSMLWTLIPEILRNAIGCSSFWHALFTTWLCCARHNPCPA